MLSKFRSIETCGSNFFHQLCETSNNQDVTKLSCISPPLNLDFDVYTILSYSIYGSYAIIINSNKEAFFIGDNGKDQKIIIKSLPPQVFEKPTKFEIKDREGQIWKPISVVCGFEYALFIASNSKNSEIQLVYSNSRADYPLFLKVKRSKPVALYGGSFSAAAIDDEGNVIFIKISDLLDNKTINSFSLPNNEKAVNIACCDKLFIVLSSSGILYQALNEKDTCSFFIIQDFEGKKIADISGTFTTVFAISEEGDVYGCVTESYGLNNIGVKTKKILHFMKISSLNKYKIRSAYAGDLHSLFQTTDGKILGCGSNACGELPGIKISSNAIIEPVETSIQKGASFCIAGANISVIFYGDVPPKMPNCKITLSDNNTNDEENKLLKAEILNLQNENKLLRSKIKKLDSTKPTNKHNEQNSFTILNQETINKMTRICLIGKGAQADVYKVSRPNECALKILTLSQKTAKESDNFKSMKQLFTEYEILCALDHPNIVKPFGFCLGDKKNPPSILMQLCSHNLNEVLNDFSSLQRICAIYEISFAMKAVHAAKLIHRDLKPENILIDEDGHVRLSDFGICCIVDIKDQTRTSGIGSLKFMAPEVLNESKYYDEKVDVYSFGVVAFLILTNELPDINVANQSNGKKADIPASVNSLSRKLINDCWSKEAKDRPSFAEIVKLIKENNFQLIDDCKTLVPQIKSFLSL